MGISLNGLTPAGTYPGLIKTGDNTAISGTPKVLSDGNGNNLPMEVSTTGVNFTNNLTQGGTALQPVLVSGTNIKTINGASLLGSGNIPVVTSPSGVSGAIQFSDGSAFASDATTFFWDNINKRLGIGTNSPASALSIVQSIALSAGSTNQRIGNIAYTINNSGAQTGTLTGIFLNATETNLNGQTHNLLDLQVGGVSKFKVLNSGRLTIAGSFDLGISSAIVYTGRSAIQSPADSIILFTDNSGATFNRLQLGGTTSGFPAIKRNGTSIDFRLADDSGFCTITANNIAGNIGIFGGGIWSSVYRTSEGGIWNTLAGTGINIKATLSTLIAMTGIPTTRPATTGDLYQDTAANILANGDRVIGIRV